MAASPGARLWVKRYNGPGNSEDQYTSLAVSPDGTKVFVTGTSLGSTSGEDYATIAYSASTGAMLWVARYNGPGNGYDVAYSIAVSPDGKEVFVTGGATGSKGGSNYATIAYSASTGAMLWVARYNGPRNGNDFAFSIGVSPDGTEVFVTGRSPESTRDQDQDYATLAYSASTGAMLWVARYNGPGNGNDYVFSLGVSPDGTEVFVTGGSAGSKGGSDYATIAYSASTGSRLWVARYNGPGNGYATADSVGVSPDGAVVFVTGGSPGSTSGQDYATLAYSASTGARLWAKRYNGPGNGDDDALSLGVSPDGTEVFVTGYSAGSTSGQDYATLAYSASTGASLWVKRYNGPANSYDFTGSLEVSPDGIEVLVTGSSVGSTSGFDYATLAYSVR